MNHEDIRSIEPDFQPAEYFNRLLNEKAELHDAILKKVVGEDVWARQREIEEISRTSLIVDSKGLVDAFVSVVEEDSVPETPENEERDVFVDVEDALMNVERTYLDGFVAMDDEATPYLVKRNNPQLINDPVSGKRALVRFLEFVTTSPDGDIQREWYSSSVANRDYSLSLLAWERLSSAEMEGVELQQSAFDEEHKLLLFMAIENLNDLYRRLLDEPEDLLRSELAL